MDILAVREATKWCADYIRSGKVDRSVYVCVCSVSYRLLHCRDLL